MVRPNSRGNSGNTAAKPQGSTSASARRKRSVMPASAGAPTVTIGQSILPGGQLSPSVNSPMTPQPPDAPVISTPVIGGASQRDASWRLRVFLSDPSVLTIAKDTEKEDRYKMIKDSWEATQPGRAARAREAREAYLKQLESGAVKPVAFLVPPAAESINSTERTAMRKLAKGEPVVVRASDLVCKPWTIIKEDGSGGRPLSELAGGPARISSLAVYGAGGTQLTIAADDESTPVAETDDNKAVAV
ncbi:hypothetical protein HK405_007341, partial [Cladochytrium tenue]